MDDTNITMRYEYSKLPLLPGQPSDSSYCYCKQAKYEHIAGLTYVLLITIQVYLSCLVLGRFLQLPSKIRQNRKRYIIFLPIILVLSLARFSLYVREDSPRLVDTPGLWHTYGLPGSPHEYAMSFGCAAMLSLLGDAFSAWRASVVWGHNQFLKYLPAAAFILHFGVCISSSIFKFNALQNLHAKLGPHHFWWNPYEQQCQLERREIIRQAQTTYQWWRIADFSMSVVVSIVSTALISARLFIMERRMTRVAEKSGTLSSNLPYRQLVAMLLESALPFTLVSIAGAICTGLLDSKTNTYSRALPALPILMVVWTNALALGPQLTVLRIISGTTWTSNPSTHHSRPISQPIIFADDPVVSLLTSADDENEDQKAEALHPAIASGILHPEGPSSD
ncbi:hypothetical protein BKA70DRAFT_1491422 [Coprinopsis sp. MPI-PUGE-AT-0042]|nr:hypothetical protein BKA70DRAFT_1491422 [Coprinopsis sp. MPI-PUGE-AT-0042]